MNGNEEARNQLMVRANEARTKLLHTVEQLDRRRHEALDVRLQLRRHLSQLVLAGVVMLLATAGGIVLAVRHIANTAQRRRHDRWRLAKRLWWRPDRALRSEQPRLYQALVRSLLFAILSTVITEPARRATKALLVPRSDGSSGSNGSVTHS
jgi:ABC-type Fe3+ transport system permease subunit